MTASECLRKAYPNVFDWWWQSMETLRLSSATVSSTWRPHTGSTRHRYSLALDINYLTGLVDVSPTEIASTTIHLHVSQGNSNPANPQPPINAAAQHARALSKSFHRYLAEERAGGHIGSLGGPWPLTRAQVGLTGNTTFIVTDSGHTHHVRISVGTDQP